MSRIDDLRTAFSDAREATLATLADLSPDDWATEVQSEGEHWTVRHVVDHLVDTEASQAMLIVRLLDGEETVPADFDVDRWNRRVRKMEERDSEETVAALAAAHEQMEAVLARVTDDDLGRTGRHPALGEEASLERFLESLAWHEGHHLGEITRGLGIGQSDSSANPS